MQKIIMKVSEQYSHNSEQFTPSKNMQLLY